MRVIKSLLLIAIFSLVFTKTLFSQVDTAWVRIFEDTVGTSRPSVAASFALDAKGNIYVAGTYYNSDNSLDYMTIKYSPSGTIQWINKYNSLTNLDDSATRVTIDKFGYVYVTGVSYLSSQNSEITTIKYTQSGNMLWSASYYKSKFEDYLCVPSAIAVDDSGNVYIAGKIRILYSDNDYLTIKYDASGFEQWVTTYNGPRNSDDQSVAIAVDNRGNVFVTGYSIGLNSGYDFATIKYDASGVKKWVSRYNGLKDIIDVEDKPTAIALDNKSDVYVTGYSKSFITKDYITIKYDVNGKEDWIRRYSGDGGGDDEPLAMVIYDSKYIYLAGYSTNLRTGSSQTDYTTIKYNTSSIREPLGKMVWLRNYAGNENGNAIAKAIALDSSGNIYVTGTINNTTPISQKPPYQNFATIKYNSFGDSIWAIQYGSQSGNNDVYQIATDVKRNIYLLAKTQPVNSNKKYTIIKYTQIR
jgi:hypothetical protein